MAYLRAIFEQLSSGNSSWRALGKEQKRDKKIKAERLNNFYATWILIPSYSL